MSTNRQATFSRFSATGSAGGRNGMTFGTFDRQERRVVAWHRTFQAAQRDAQRRNREARA